MSTLLQNLLNVPLGKWFGIPVRLHFSWVILFLVVVALSPAFAITYAGLFAIVLLHEFGHCVAGRYYNMVVKDITLYPIGGVARMEIPVQPKEEIVVALAGPAVNVVLIPVLWLLAGFHGTLDQLHWFNLILLGFNLLPVFPMDGGRVFRAALALYLKNYERGTIIAARVGQVFCIGFGIVGFMTSNVGLLIIGGFIFFAAQSEIQNIQMKRAVKSLYKQVTGDDPPITTHNDVYESARMLDDIQQRLAAIDRRD